ncbi:branched-chain amino acid ABC transporter permease [Youngiibacter fragilis]|uniref:Branched-chain amino acid ABC transporter permease n=1 Tax=Youngiibacter fragilis 232.1 TaxID=994573 RepID=V7I7R0_9CLOT|nr:branched-chain amino acid ABC transporter permease [Youngiibacter fragilis]ETA81918.1 branched-chain amino acid ABC transporter permease [Youngiibacter fragilis 232.1]
MMNVSKALKNNIVAVILFILFFTVPLFLKNNYLLSILVQIFLFAALGSAWNIIGGFARQISWAHASFFLVGAYTGMLMFQYLKISPWISVFVGVVLSIIFAIFIGAPSFRLRGTYFSLATIAVGQMIRELVVYFAGFTGGNNGIVISSKYKGFAVMRWNQETPYYYIFLILLILILGVVYVVDRGRLGYYLKAIREDQDAAESLGIRSSKVKMNALIISAACTSVLGTFYAFKMSYVDPTMVGSFDLAVKIGVIAIVGGIGTFWGPLLGAIVIIPLMEACNAFLPATWSGASLALYGLILMLIVIFKPEGFWSIVTDVKANFTKKKALTQLKGDS